MLPSIRPVPISGHLKQLSVNEVCRTGTEYFSFKMQVLACLQLERQLRKALFCSVSKLFMANINAVYCAVKLLLFK